MRRCSVLTGTSDGVDGGVGEDGGVARSDTRGQERTSVVGGARGEAVGGGTVAARHGDGALTGGPGAGSGG
jgi:hypothetical protein